MSLSYISINGKVYPNDTVSSSGTLAIKLPMNNSSANHKPSMFNMSKTTEEQAVSNFINLLLTKDGERYMQPEFGVGLYYKVFEPNTANETARLKTNIMDQASMWLPYIIIERIEIGNESTPGDVQSLEEHAMPIFIDFRVTESGANRTISIFVGSDSNLNVNIG